MGLAGSGGPSVAGKGVEVDGAVEAASGISVAEVGCEGDRGASADLQAVKFSITVTNRNIKSGWRQWKCAFIHAAPDRKATTSAEVGKEGWAPKRVTESAAAAEAKRTA